MKLVVITQFADYQIGDEITEQAKIDAILESDQAHFVVKVAVSAPAAKSKAAD
ncbi:hypothetical protein [Duganella guangzhouensis]|uniref:hypothetical protein n=1 Tax=Duganella guangzhouensis TaxID=2666084 RepID=UPI0018A23D37|nr:hypothetical protein [Duganella guangzhouensis]